MRGSGRGAAARLLEPLRDLIFAGGWVEQVEQLTLGMRRIRLTGPGLLALGWTPGQQVRVNIVDPASRIGVGVLRTYTVWSYDGAHLDLCVLDHGDGPGARWVRGLKAGDQVSLRKPEGRFVTDNSAAYHVFVGEETASVAFGAMLRALPPDARVYGAVEVPGEADRLPLPRSAELTWYYRGTASAAESATLVAAVRKLDLPEEPGVAYVAGEARTCQAVRDQLVRERGWPRRSVLIKPFWTPGKRGLE